MISHRIGFMGCVLAIALLATPGFGQSKSDDAYIDALRADLRADKVAVVTEAMKLSDKEAAAFWPVYKKYDQELVSLNDELIKLVKSYADKYGAINDADATSMTTKALDIQARRVAVKKKYFPIMAKATSALTAAKFFQLDYRLELAWNVRLASELPALLIQFPAMAAPAKTN